MKYAHPTPSSKRANQRFRRAMGAAAILLAFALLSCENGSNQPAAQPASDQPATPRPVSKAQPSTITPSDPIPKAPVTVGSLRIEPGGFDYGMIPPKSTHEFTTVLRNLGSRPIEILEAKPDCACTVPQDVSGTIIPAGGSVPFHVTFNAPTEPGPKTAKLFLIFNDAGQQRHALIKLDGMITMPVRAEPPYVDALKGVTTGQTRVESVDGRPFQIISTNGEPPVYTDGFDPRTDQPRNAYEVQWTIPPRTTENCQGMRLWWVIETDHPDCPILPMRVRHECTGGLSDPDRKRRGWQSKEVIAQLGAMQAGVPIEVDVDILNKKNVRIFAVQSRSSAADAELVSTSPKEGGITTYRVRLTPRRGYEGMLYAMVLFRSDTGSKDIAFIGRVMPQNGG